MYEQSIIRQMKQTNISRDAEKTKQRVEAAWKAAGRQEKQEVEALAGIARATIYRVYNTGSLSAKLAAAMAQTLQVSPYYLAGFSDENNAYSEDQLDAFLAECGYETLVTAKNKPPRKRRAKAVSEGSEAAVDSEPCIASPEDTSLSPDAQAFVDAMTEEDMIVLMRSILLRAKAGGEAAALAERLKRLLIS